MANNNELNLLEQLLKSLKGQISSTAKELSQLFSLRPGVMTLAKELQNIPREVIKINTAMMELRKVSNASSSSIQKYFEEAASHAKKLGTSVCDVINATADWSRKGYNLPDAKKLAETALLYKNISDGISLDSANEFLDSALQGFQLQAKDAMEVIDKFRAASKNFQIDDNGIGEALQRSAASFHAANTDLSKSIALITAASNVNSDSNAVGDMWKTIADRILLAEQGLDAAGGEMDSMTKSTDQLRSLVQDITGFDILPEQSGSKLMDVYDIIVGIGREWSTLTTSQQTDLLGALVEDGQSDTLRNVLNNVSMVEGVYQTVQHSSGLALREQQQSEEGIAYSLNRLDASFQTFANHILDSGFLKGIVDFGNGAIQVLDNVTNALGGLGTIGMSAGLFAGLKNAGRVKCNPSYRICLL